MRFHLGEWVLLGLLAIVPLGCEPTTVVDDEPDGATIVEDEDNDADTVVVPDGTDTTMPPPSRADTDQGVDVNVNTPSTPPASGSDAGEDTTPRANQ